MTIQIDDAGFEFPCEESRWVWIAGIIDAESSLELAKSKIKGQTKENSRFRDVTTGRFTTRTDAECKAEIVSGISRGFRYVPRMACSSTTVSLLLQVKKACHPYGSVSSHHHQDKRNSYWNRTNKFMMFGNGLRVILPKVLPYLVVKKSQAILLAEALNLLTKGPKSQKTEDRLEQIWLQIRNLNRRGKGIDDTD